MNIVLESYETSDIANWVSDQGIPCEVTTATSTQQMASFSELRRIAAESRLNFPDNFKDLAYEMSTFVYTIGKGNRVKFGHDSNKHKDDRVYSLQLSVYATRETVLSLYVMGNIQCHNRTPRRRLCFIMGGDMSPFCANECRAYHQLAEMFKEYKRHRLDDDINISEFYNTKVKQVGAKIYQAA